MSVVKEISNNPPLPVFRMHILSKLKYMTNVNTINLVPLKIQPRTIDVSTRLRGINYRVTVDIHCFRLNLKKSKLGYWTVAPKN